MDIKKVVGGWTCSGVANSGTKLTFPKYKTSTINWVKSSASISGTDFMADSVEFPDFWSDTAKSIVASKYFARNSDGTLKETSLKEMINRVVSTIGFWGVEQNYFDNEERFKFEDYLSYLIYSQKFSFNSPVWFNVGVDGTNPCQVSACFINSVEDNMESILELAKTEGLIFKNGSGSGTNFSSLRSSKENTHGGGTASGPMSFMKGYDSFAGVIKSGGRLRRSAAMRILNVDHPDVVEFIECKTKEEKKAQALVAAGYDGSFGGEAQSSVAFQNANNSVRVSDDFMRAVEDDGEWELKAVTDGHVVETVRARDIFRKICQNAWECGDPGLQFDDTINRAWTCKHVSRINASNPCSEVHLPDDSACNLASVNLLKYFSEGKLDSDSLELDIKFILTAMDIIIDKGVYPTESITQNSHDYRPLGLGYTNLGAVLMSKGLSYDSEKGRKVAKDITKFFDETANEVSRWLGQNLGTFTYAEGSDAPENRNSQVTVLAPTGTISFMMDAVTTGVEPELSLRTVKQLSGGGTITKINTIVPLALKVLGYSDKEIEVSIKRLNDTGSLSGTIKKKHEDVFLCSFPDPITSKCLNPESHTKMMSAVQPYISGAISKTVNLPNSATVEDIWKIYMDAWGAGLKCIAVYRDGCKVNQPVTNGFKKENGANGAFGERHRLPDERAAITHHFDVSGHDGYLTVGLYEDGSPGEVFLQMAKEGTTVSGFADSFATMLSLGLQHGVPLRAIVDKLKFTRFEPAGFTTNKDIPMTDSPSDYMAKWLEMKFLSNKPSGKVAEKTVTVSDGSICPVCGQTMVRKGTCYQCVHCGNANGACG